MTLAEKKALVGDFVARCNRYADGKLARYREELQAASGAEALALEEKIARWTAYKTFNEHTLGELKTDTLDDWFV